jgi:hypothetical protein
MDPQRKSRPAHVQRRYLRDRIVTERRLTTQYSHSSKELPRLKLRGVGKKIFPGRPGIDLETGRKTYTPRNQIGETLYTEWNIICTWAYWNVLHCISFLVPYFQRIEDVQVRDECLNNVSHFFDNLPHNKIFAAESCRLKFIEYLASMKNGSTHSLITNADDHYAFAKSLHDHHCGTAVKAETAIPETVTTLPFEKVKRFYEARCLTDDSDDTESPTIMETWLKSEFKIDIVRDFQNLALVRVIGDPKIPMTFKNVLNFNYIIRITSFYSESDPNGYWKPSWRRPTHISKSEALFETDFRMLQSVDYFFGIVYVLCSEIIQQLASCKVIA